MKLVKIPIEAKQVVIGQKPRRGRSCKTKKALEYQSEADKEERVVSSIQVLKRKITEVEEETPQETNIIYSVFLSKNLKNLIFDYFCMKFHNASPIKSTFKNCYKFLVTQLSVTVFIEYGNSLFVAEIRISQKDLGKFNTKRVLFITSDKKEEHFSVI
ncbi:hypothetical protein BpHYR1_020354 [Brachionus plicatilis]|uniref:Uncharacterized protein n=1 Tax=Brachionus plicatilis TaxID=10195 RepID=A0A3M7QH60_BRAPC|nr:hypothetical protein BpHYR1_020354 [Brachionus plicatilis]